VVNNLNKNQVASNTSLKESCKETHFTNTDLINLRRSQSDNNDPENFTDYFKQLRQTQFEGSKKIDENRKQMSLLEKIKEQPFKSQPTDEEKILSLIDSIKFKNNKNSSREENTVQAKKNYIKEVFNDEYDFSNVVKSIKYHKSKTNEEIIKEVSGEFESVASRNTNKFDHSRSVLNNISNKNSNSNKNAENERMFKNYLETSKNISQNSDLISNEAQEMMFCLELNRSRAEVEDMIRKHNNMDTYLSRCKYKAAKSQRTYYLNIMMVSLIVIIMVGYWIFEKYLTE